MNRKQLILHIGTHKTGSTALQQFLWDHRRRLSRHGIGLYRGLYKKENHIELFLASMRYDRDSFARSRLFRDRTIDAEFTHRVSEAVRGFIGSREERRLLFTAEGLCLLRFPDEISRLQEILDADHNDVRIVLYLRNKTDFLRSYTRQVLKSPGRRTSDDPTSSFYVQPDTWLTDYDALLSTYRAGFGDESVTVIDYDAEMARAGNIIPAFLRAVGLEDELNCAGYFQNQSHKSGRWHVARRIYEFSQRSWYRLWNS